MPSRQERKRPLAWPRLLILGLTIAAVATAVFLGARAQLETSKQRAELLTMGFVVLAMLAGGLSLLVMSYRRSRHLEREVARRTNELRETASYLDNLIRHANAPIIVWDPKKRVTRFNKAFEKMSGRTESEMMGQPLDILFPDDNRAACLERIEGASAGEFWLNVEMPILHKDGEIRVGSWNSSNIHAEDSKELIATVAQGHDITEQKRTQEALARHRDHLEELAEERTRQLNEAHEKLIVSGRLAVLGQLSGSISHEIRNPLGVIDSSVYYLKMKLSGADAKVQEHLSRIKGEVVKCTSIIQSLLNLTGMKKPVKGPLNLAEAIDSAIAGSKIPPDISIVREVPDCEVFVNADAEQLGMMFKNIIVNAVQAMEESGTLAVSVHTENKDWAEVTWRDTGPGIALEVLGKVFEPLFSTKAKGIGFGLSICRMIAESHGGSIDASSEPGQGAAFVVRLPLCSRNAE